MKRRTKILVTVGPATWSYEKIRELAVAGMNVVRLNFSHGAHEKFNEVIHSIREVEKELGQPIGILADIQGPKIRVGKLVGGQMELVQGGTVRINVQKEPQEGVIPITYKDFVRDVGVGKRILLDDGLIELRSTGFDGDALRCEVLNGGTVYENKGVNTPETSFSVHPITEKDYADILFCLGHEVDYIAMSFVRTAQEVRHLKEYIHSRKQHTQVIAKIEMHEAVQNFDSICREADGILVARGDLAVEVGNERVPVLQKNFVRQSNLRGKPVIIATQMLMSMVENPRPTRAEATDVANAIVEGADAVMLSNETAVGKYPIESVRMMSKIVEEMEFEMRAAPQSILYNEWKLEPKDQMAIALLQSAVRLASIVKARAIVVGTSSGHSARLVSKCRPSTPVYAVAGSQKTYRQLSLLWGVEPFCMPDMENLVTKSTIFEAIGQRLLALNLVNSGDKIVVTAGLPRLVQGSTNTIKIHEI